MLLASVFVSLLIAVGVVVFKHKTWVSHTPAARTRLNKNSLETAEWLGVFTDKLYAFLHDEFAGDVKLLLESRTASTLEERGYVRNAKFDVVSFGEALPRIEAVDVVESTSSSVVLDVEVGYRSAVDIRFAADIPIARGRLLPCAVEVRDVDVAGHVRVSMSSVTLASDLDRPVATVDVSLMSEPAFAFQLHTAIGSRHKLRNFLLIPFVVRRVLLKVLTKKCVYPNGVTRVVPLPRWHAERPHRGESEESSMGSSQYSSSDY